MMADLQRESRLRPRYKTKTIEKSSLTIYLGKTSVCEPKVLLLAAGALEVGDQVLALGGLLDTGEDHLGTLYVRIGEERSGDMM